MRYPGDECRCRIRSRPLRPGFSRRCRYERNRPGRFDSNVCEHDYPKFGATITTGPGPQSEFVMVSVSVETDSGCGTDRSVRDLTVSNIDDGCIDEDRHVHIVEQAWPSHVSRRSLCQWSTRRFFRDGGSVATTAPPSLSIHSACRAETPTNGRPVTDTRHKKLCSRWRISSGTLRRRRPGVRRQFLLCGR